jgi:small-conductance mechanosensitive channel
MMQKDKQQLLKKAKSLKTRVILLLKFLLLVGLIVIQIIFPALNKNYGIPTKYLDGLLFYITGNLIIDFTRLLVVDIYLRRIKQNAQPNFALGVNRIASVISFSLLIIVIFIVFEINTQEFFTSISIVAAAIAIVFKELIANFVNGLLIMFTDDISLGDEVEIVHHKGKIIDITLINLHLLTDDDDLVYIPNSTVLNTDVVNYTRRVVNRVGFDFQIGYAYLQNVSELEAYIQEALHDCSQYIVPQSYNLKTMEIHQDFAVMKYQYTLHKPDKEIETHIRRKIARKIIDFVNR